MFLEPISPDTAPDLLMAEDRNLQYPDDTNVDHAFQGSLPIRTA